MDKGTLSILVAALMVTSGLFGLFLVGDSAGGEAEEIMGMPPEDTTNRIEMPKSTSDHFTRNMGQWDSGLEYIGKADMGYVGFTRDGVYFDVIKEVEDDENGIPCFTGHVIELTFDGSNYVRPRGEEEIAAQYNYLIGEESNWVTHVPNFNMVSYDNVWDGIDVNYRYGISGVKYDIILSPGADPDNVLITMKGQDDMKILGDSLVVDVDGEVTLVDSELDVFYQDAPSEKIDAVFERVDRDTYTFSLGDYDDTRTVVIDPLFFSSWLGGQGTDYGYGIGVDGDGNAIVVGYTTYSNPEFPTTPGAYQQYRASSSYDAFMTKFHASGEEIYYSTFIGGYQSDYCYGGTADDNGYGYVTGYTRYYSSSGNYPSTSGAYQTSINTRYSTSYYDAFVSKISPDGSTLEASTFLGGAYYEYGYDVDVDSSGYIYAGGYTGYSSSPSSVSEFPVTSGAWITSRTNYMGYMTKFDSSLSTIIWSTFLGGSTSSDYCYDIACDDSGYGYANIDVYSTNMPVTSGAFQASIGGGRDKGVVKLHPTTGAAIWASYLGGSSYEYYGGIDVDDSGYVYVSGYTQSSNFPTVNAYDSSYNSYEIFVTKFNPNGASVVYSTYMGTSSSDYVDYHNIAAGSNGNAYVIGRASTSGFPITMDAYDTSYNGGYDYVIFNLSSSGNSLGYSTYLGSSGYEYPYGGIALDKYNNMHVTGYCYTSNFPTTSGAYDTSYQSYDATVSKLGSAFADDIPPRITADRSDAVAYGGQSFRFKADMSDNVWLEDAYVEYWAGSSGTHTNVSLSLVSLEGTPNLPNSIGTLYYYFSAKDYHDNWGKSTIYNRTLLDGIGPTFSNIGANPYPPVTGSPLNITVDVYDNVAYNASTVTLYYKDPRAPSFTSVVMNHASGNTFYYVGNVSIYWDTIYFYFEAYDYSMNLGRSPTSGYYYTYVYDNVPPTFVNNQSPTSGTTGDRFDVLITMNDNIGIGYAYIVYWYGLGLPTTKSLSISGGGYGANQLGTTTLYIPSNSMDTLYYYYDFRDYDGNYWTSGPSSTFTVPITDNDAPVLRSVISPLSTTTGEPSYFSFDFLDNIDGTAIAGAAVNYSYNNDWGNQWSLPLSYNSTTQLWTSTNITVSANSLGPLTFQVNSTDHQGNKMEHRGLVCPIYDNDDPIFNADNTLPGGTTGDPHNFTINAYDNIEISTVFLHMEYLNGIPYAPLTLMDAGGGNFYRVVNLEHKLAPITYNFTIIDSSGNWIKTGDFTVTLSDNDKPDIVDMTRKVVKAGEEDFPIKAIIIDNIELESIEMEYWFSFDPAVRKVTLSVLSPDVYYYLVDIPSTPGTMSYKFKATDFPGGNINEVVHVVEILDAVAPEITGVTAEGTAYTGDEYSISATVTDNIDVRDAKLFYSFGMETPLYLEMTGSDDTYSCTISVPHALDPLFFWLEATDEQDNRMATEIFMVPVADNDLPVMEVDLSDTEATTGDAFMLKMNATDNIGIGEVVVSLMYPGGDWENHTMMVMDRTYYLEVTMPNDVVGTFSYYFTVYDTSMNMVGSNQVDVTIADDEQPFAVIVGPDETYQHMEVGFTSEGSMDNVGIAEYKWEINGEPFEGSEVAYTFHDVGEYVVELKVDDGVNPVVNATHMITVRDADDPVIVLDLPDEIGNHLRLVADASGSTDNVGIVSYSWLVVLPDSTKITGSDEVFEYDLVGIIGNLTIYLTIMDAEGNYASNVYQVDVRDLLAPVVRAPGDAAGREETILKFSDQGTTDNTGIKSYMWTITFNDEDVVRYGKTISYFFEKVGTYNITLTVFDAYDNFASDYFLVEITEQDPNLDSDGDGMPDWWEDEHSLDKGIDDSQRDYDRDLLTNLQEYKLGTDPNNPDTDGDGLPDNWEYKYAYDEDKTELVDGVPRWMAEFDGADDTDLDGDTNLEEYLQGSRDPTVMDAKEEKEEDNTLLVIIIALIVILVVALILIALIMILGRVRPVDKEFPEERFPHLYKKD